MITNFKVGDLVKHSLLGLCQITEIERPYQIANIWYQDVGVYSFEKQVGYAVDADQLYPLDPIEE